MTDAPEPVARDVVAAITALAPDGVVCGSVVPAMTTALARECTTARLPFRALTYADFRRLMPMTVRAPLAPGVDRCANAYALYRSTARPAACVDAGTAVTLDILDAAGCFRGGAILPGSHLQLSALHRETAVLATRHALPPQNASLGSTTAAALAAGVFTGTYWAILGLLSQTARNVTGPFRSVVVTGGNGTRIARFLREHNVPAAYAAAHTLHGLLLASRKYGPLRSTS